MKKLAFFILFVSLFLCSCGKKESKSDIDYIFLDRVGSMFYMEDYELFGAKTKNIDFQFMDYVAVQEYDLTKEIEGQELFYQKLYDITDQLLRVCKINCVYLHRLFDTPIFRTKKCFRQYCE